jgi:hypothetical protein
MNAPAPSDMKHVIVGVRGNVRALVRIRPQIEELWNAQLGERLGPDAQRAIGVLLLEYDLPVLVAHGDEIAVVVEVHELLAPRSPSLLKCS